MPGKSKRSRASPLEFVAVSRFMMTDLELTGIPLLVYARIFGFEVRGEGFYEAKANLARFLGTTERSVYRAFADLLEQGLILEHGESSTPNGRKTKSYGINWAKVPFGVAEALGRIPIRASPDETSPVETSGVLPPIPDETSWKRACSGDETSGQTLTGCHPIRKKDNKGFR